MPDPDALTAFYLAVEEDPADPVTLLALADWYEEHDQLAAAEAVRWAVHLGRRPYCYPCDGGLKVSSPSWHVGWFWWAVDDAPHARDWGHPLHCRLPRAVWAKLRHTINHPPGVFKEYPNPRAAYEALINAWPLVGPIELYRDSAKEVRP